MDAVKEIELCQILGVSRCDIRKIRAEDLSEGPHWFKEGKYIYITPEGVAKMKTRLQTGPADENAAVPHEDLCARKPAPIIQQPSGKRRGTAVVNRVTPNKRIVECTVDGVAKQRVMVKDNKNFIPGMIMQVVKLRDRDMWELEGNCPRWKGRW